MEVPDAAFQLAAGGLRWAVFLAGIDLASFVLVVFARRLLGDVELEYRPRIFRCFLRTPRQSKQDQPDRGDEPSVR